METFTDPKEFVDDPRYAACRENTLAALDLASIEEPIVDTLQDEAVPEHAEALRTQAARDLFFTELRAVLAAESTDHTTG